MPFDPTFDSLYVVAMILLLSAEMLKIARQMTAFLWPTTISQWMITIFISGQARKSLDLMFIYLTRVKVRMISRYPQCC